MMTLLDWMLGWREVRPYINRYKTDSNGRQEALEAKHHAEEDLSKIREEGHDVAKVVASLRDKVERNHFAEQLEQTFRKRP